MKKVLIGVLTACLLVLLGATRSLYVEGAEFVSIIAVIIGCSGVVHIFSDNTFSGRIVIVTAAAGFFLSWILGAADIVIDHYLYFLPTGMEDGASLTLGFKLEEFNDDLFLASLFGMVITVISSYIVLRISGNNTSKTS
jgi:hypothetical protein